MHFMLSNMVVKMDVLGWKLLSRRPISLDVPFQRMDAGARPILPCGQGFPTDYKNPSVQTQNSISTNTTHLCGRGRICVDAMKSTDESRIYMDAGIILKFFFLKRNFLTSFWIPISDTIMLQFFFKFFVKWVFKSRLH